jgi:hypothetical protein
LLLKADSNRDRPHSVSWHFPISKKERLEMKNMTTYTSFAGHRRIASGELKSVLLATKAHIDQSGIEAVLVFDDATGRQIDFNFRGTPEDVVANLATHPLFAEKESTLSPTEPTPRTGPGRPKLGVVCREVSLLPRHWQWLDAQPGGVSVTLRKLVEEAKKREDGGAQAAKRAQEAAARFMWSMAGDFAGFEEASRSLFAGDYARLRELMAGWPPDIRDHLEHLVSRARAPRTDPELG